MERRRGPCDLRGREPCVSSLRSSGSLDDFPVDEMGVAIFEVDGIRIERKGLGFAGLGLSTQQRGSSWLMMADIHATLKRDEPAVLAFPSVVVPQETC